MRPAPYRFLTGPRRVDAAPPPLQPWWTCERTSEVLLDTTEALRPLYCRILFGVPQRSEDQASLSARDSDLPINCQNHRSSRGQGQNASWVTSCRTGHEHSIAYPCHASLSWLGLPIDKGRAAMRPEPVPTVPEPPRQVRTMQSDSAAHAQRQGRSEQLVYGLCAVAASQRASVV